MLVPETEILISIEGQELLRRTLRPGDYVLGRSPACELCVPSSTVSRKHARLTVNFSNLFLEDLGSFNGTTVNGGRISGRIQIWHGQRIQFGSVLVELRKIVADLDLGASLAPAQEAVLESLPDDVTFQHSGYRIGQLIGRGGMGAVLQAEDASIQRHVAMKVVLHADSPRDVLRFIHEARITGRLEHPHIVPIHTLGADEHGQPFYTMKLVRGATLKQVLNDLSRSEESTIRTYPLTTLLSIFTKVCDAMRFAHSQKVIHRDLKPDNIMLGDFGEVLVMDWGLAKSLDESVPELVLDPSTAHTPIEEKEGSNTLTGAILGTPQYMPPEQALGQIERVDERADVYSLGAILYHILVLRPPIDPGPAEQVLAKVIRGEIVTPTQILQRQAHLEDQQTPTAPLPVDPDAHIVSLHLPHLPGGRIPASLEAMVLKAMAHDPTARYATVDEMQKDLAAYRLGFATQAEHAGSLKRLQLLIKRHRTFSAAVLTGVLLTAGFGIGLAREVERSAQALVRLRKAAPTFVERAWGHLEEGRLQDALEKVDFAVEVDPTNADYQMLRARLLQGQVRLAEAAAAFKKVLALRKDTLAAENFELCVRLQPAPGEELGVPSKVVLLHALQRQNRHQDAKPLLANLKSRAAELAPLLEQRLSALPGWDARRLQKTADGTFVVDLSWLRFESLNYFDDMPLAELTLNGCGPSLTPSVLEGIAKLPLKSLSMRGCNLQDIEFLTNCSVESLVLASNPFTDLSPIKGAPLRRLNLRETPANELTPLAACLYLEELILPQKPRNFEWLRSSPTLKRISLKESNNGAPDRSVEEFWKG